MKNFYSVVSFHLIMSLLFYLLGIDTTYGQSLERGISIGETTSHTNSILNISATNRGVLFPRMTTNERQSITINSENSPEGLLVYDTDKFAYYFYKNEKWELLSDSAYSKVRELKVVGADSLYLYQESDSVGVQVIEYPLWGTRQDTNFSIRANYEGNAVGDMRGKHSTDLQTHRWDSSQIASGDYATLMGGLRNQANGAYSTIKGGGEYSGVDSIHLANVSERGSRASGEYSTLGSGCGHRSIASGDYSTIGGGRTVEAKSIGSIAYGGEGTEATSDFSCVIGGYWNYASEYAAVAAGGRSNSVVGQYSTIRGGQGYRSGEKKGRNIIIEGSNYSTIGGGRSNTIAAQYAVISGGKDNMAAGHYSMVSGGQGNTAHSYGEWVGGLYADNYTPESITLFDSTDRLFVVGNGTDTLNRSNALTILKNGNVGIGVPAPSVALDIQGDIKLNGAIIHPSDRRLKKDITDLNNTLEIINLLSPKTYNWKDTNLNRKGKSVGLIAQDLEKILPNLVHTPLHSAININGEGITNIKTINYIGFIPYLLPATQELNKEINDLEKTLEANQEYNHILNKEINDLDAQLQAEQTSNNSLRTRLKTEQQTIKDMASEIKKMKIQMDGIRQGIEALGMADIP